MWLIMRIIQEFPLNNEWNFPHHRAVSTQFPNHFSNVSNNFNKKEKISFDYVCVRENVCNDNNLNVCHVQLNKTNNWKALHSNFPLRMRSKREMQIEWKSEILGHERKVVLLLAFSLSNSRLISYLINFLLLCTPRTLKLLRETFEWGNFWKLSRIPDSVWIENDSLKIHESKQKTNRRERKSGFMKNSIYLLSVLL
jgi:hypothetical protein